MINSRDSDELKYIIKLTKQTILYKWIENLNKQRIASEVTATIIHLLPLKMKIIIPHQPNEIKMRVSFFLSYSLFHTYIQYV